MSREPEHVVVVGGGVVGRFIAYRLAIEGVGVTLVERDMVEAGVAGSGASGTSAGNVQPGADFSGEYWRDLTVESYRLLRRFLPEIKETARTDLMDQEVQYLFPALKRDETGRLRSDSEARARTGLRVRWIDGADARELEPRLSAEVLGGMLHQDCMQLDPQRTVAALSVSAQARGAEVRLAEAAGLRRQDDRVSGVLLRDGTSVSCDTVVLAAGAWTGEMTSDWLGVRLPTQPVNVQKLHLRTRGEPLGCAVSWDGTNIVLRKDGLVHAGSRLDPASGYTAHTSEEGKSWLLQRVKTVLPGLEIESSEAMAACAVQGNTPILGPVEALEGVYVAVPRYEGFLLAAVLADMMVELLVHGKEHRFLARMLPEADNGHPVNS